MVCEMTRPRRTITSARVLAATALCVAACDDTTAFVPADPALVASVPVPPAYGLHDTYVRDGIAFLSAWNTGVIILDVGNGLAGGTPAAPVEVSRFALNTAGHAVTGRAHNTWWFHNPVSGEARYLFVGQEGPGTLGAEASGDIYVYDVATLASPRFVGSYVLPGAGAHNFWMDEAAQVLFAAYYNGGVVALDVSGTLPADLTTRERDRVVPGGTGYVWGVMQGAGGQLWATDMLRGFWRLAFDGTTLTVTGGGDNVTDRFTSDLWVHGGTGYTGTWGTRELPGNAINVWDVTSAPRLARTVTMDSVGTVSDLEVSTDGTLLLVTTENGPAAGFRLYDLDDPRDPVLLVEQRVEGGLHTGTLAEIGGRTWVFAAKNPGLEGPALVIWDVTDSRP